MDNLLDVKKFVVFSETNLYSLNSEDKTVAEEFFGLTKFRGEVLEVYRNKSKAAIRSLDDNTETVYSVGVGVNIEFVFGTQDFYADMSTKTIVYADNENSELIYDYIDSVNNVYDDDYFNIAKLKKISFKNSGKYTVADDVCVCTSSAIALYALWQTTAVLKSWKYSTSRRADSFTAPTRTQLNMPTKHGQTILCTVLRHLTTSTLL